MDEYISKHDVLVALMDNDLDHIQAPNRKEAVQILSDIPAADVAPVVHSRWIKTADGAECERCGREVVYQIIDDHWQYEPFCPHCGAIMDGQREE